VYFYIVDRLGSVRLVIDDVNNVKNTYTYNPFGEIFATEANETICNPFKFTGQYFDNEINQYYLRARQFDPYLSRFTGRDSATDKFQQPLSLHKYLYCENEPISRIDPWGLLYTIPEAGSHYNSRQTQQVKDSLIDFYEEKGFIKGSFEAFYATVEGEETIIERITGRNWEGRYVYRFSGLTFTLDDYSSRIPIKGSEFSNYLAGYAGYYFWGATGSQIMTMAGDWYAKAADGLAGDDLGSKQWLARGMLAANLDLAKQEGRGVGGKVNELAIRSSLINLNILNFDNDWEQGNNICYGW